LVSGASISAMRILSLFKKNVSPSITQFLCRPKPQAPKRSFEKMLVAESLSFETA
jgi:hypothetical protein